MSDFEDAFDFSLFFKQPFTITKHEQQPWIITQSALSFLQKDLEDELERDYLVRCALYSAGKTVSCPSTDASSEISSPATALLSVVNAK